LRRQGDSETASLSLGVLGLKDGDVRIDAQHQVLLAVGQVNDQFFAPQPTVPDHNGLQMHAGQ
jgi:hypothetical protein